MEAVLNQDRSSTAREPAGSKSENPGKWFGVPKWAVGGALVALGGVLIVRNLIGSGDDTLQFVDLFTYAGAADVTSVERAVTADPSLVDLRDPDGNTLLHVAASVGSKAEVALLLTHGANPNAANGRGFTPLVSALSAPRDRVAVVETLLGSGASPAYALPTGATVLQTATKLRVDPQVLALLSKPRPAVTVAQAKR